MLGTSLGTVTGKVTDRRVLPSTVMPTLEMTFEAAGEFGGVATTWMGTFWAQVRPDGSLYGECPQQGAIITPDGVGSWTSAGVGWFTETGGTSFRGSAYLTIAPPKLAHLTRSALLYEFDIAADGSAVGQFWAWT